MNQDVPTVSELHAFVKSSEGQDFWTLHQDKRFRAWLRADRLVITVDGRDRAVRSEREVLNHFATLRSFRPTAYRGTGTFNASYLLALIAAWQDDRLGAGRSIRKIPASSSVLSDEQRDALLTRLRAAARSLNCSVNEHRLEYGFELKKRSPGKPRWVGSAYWGKNAEGNDVELCLELSSLPERTSQDEPERLEKWVRHTVTVLENEPARNHSGGEQAWFRAGFKFEDAIEFLTQLARQSLGHLHEHERWVVPETGERIPEQAEDGDGAEGRAAGRLDGGIDSPTGEDPRQPRVGAKPFTPVFASVEHMVKMARAACAASGQRTETINKTKQFLFASDDELRQHIAELIEHQARRCALTGLSLHFAGDVDADLDRVASLDRKDSDGHYAPGNLQVVCRFANRWKSDDTNENFLRLIELIFAQRSR